MLNRMGCYNNTHMMLPMVTAYNWQNTGLTLLYSYSGN